MSKPLDFLGNPITVGATVIYVGAGYTTFERQVVTKVNPKTVTLGDQTQWGSHTRRPFTSVIVVDAIESLERKAEKLLATTIPAMSKAKGIEPCWGCIENDDRFPHTCGKED